MHGERQVSMGGKDPVDFRFFDLRFGIDRNDSPWLLTPVMGLVVELPMHALEAQSITEGDERPWSVILSDTWQQADSGQTGPNGVEEGREESMAQVNSCGQ